MSQNLVIVESPAKAKTIGRYLGPDYVISASVGHIRDLPSSTLGVDVKNDFKPRYITMPGKEKVVRELKQLAKDADRVFIATDPDREGEAIAWHIANVLKIDPASECRVSFNEITEKAVRQAIEQPRPINEDLMHAQQARRILDRLVGYEISPVLWKKIKKGLSAGRVQSVATRMIVEREEAIEAFKPEEYWNLHVILETEKKETFKAKYHGIHKGAGKPQVVKLKNKEMADQVLAAIDNKPFIVEEIKKGNRKRKPAAPFTTSTLQQEAARRLGYSARKTMSIAQQLYEGVDLPEVGPTALVTYIRTDSVRISNEALDEAKRLILSGYGEDYLPKKPNTYKNKNASQDAHEAIRPAHFDHQPMMIRELLTNDQFRLYRLIWDRFLASQMANASIDTLTVSTTCADQLFRSTGEQIVFAGFLAAYEDVNKEKTKKEEEEEAAAKSIIPPLVAKQELNCKEKLPEQKFTLPPPRFTEASLIKAMEEDGIGRPSTYAPTISTILDRRYAEKDQRQLVPTKLGRTVTEMLRSNFDEYINESFTASMESGLDTVESGDQNWVELLDSFYPGFHQKVEDAYENIEKIVIEDKKTGEMCPECGKELVIKDGRYGSFIACSGFPECKYTNSIVVKTGTHCPKCGSDIVSRKSKRGSIFYLCEKTNDKDCDFISWDMPLDNQNCEVCGSYMVEKRFRGKTYVRCGNKECPTNQRKKSAKKSDTSAAEKSGAADG